MASNDNTESSAMDDQRSSRNFSAQMSSDDPYLRRLSGPLNSHPPSPAVERHASELAGTFAVEDMDALQSDSQAVHSTNPSEESAPRSSENSESIGDGPPEVNISPLAGVSDAQGSGRLNAIPSLLDMVENAPRTRSDSASSHTLSLDESIHSGVDVMNDPAFDPPLQRTDTTNSHPNGLNRGSEKGDTCRICRCEGTAEESLFYPCKCSGSIKFVHQECLMEWLSHSKKKHCELCKTPFHFTKLYDANMPRYLPWLVFIQRACLHVFSICVKLCRVSLVACIWMIILPWFIRWAWRWMFWLADAGWAREDFLRQSYDTAQQSTFNASATGAAPTTYASFRVIKDMAARLRPSTLVSSSNATMSAEPLRTYHDLDVSILSSWTYLSKLTPNASVNRVILDIFEGQLVTCLIIIGFVLVFLIREWVVQQQPHAHLENMRNANVQLQAAAERLQAANEEVRRQEERFREQRREERRLRAIRHEKADLEQEAGRLTSIFRTAGFMHEHQLRIVGDSLQWIGWDGFGLLLDTFTPDMERDEEGTHFVDHAVLDLVKLHINIAQSAGVEHIEAVTQLNSKLAEYHTEHQQCWVNFFRDMEPPVLVTMGAIRAKSMGMTNGNGDEATRKQLQDRESSSGSRRPRMPQRDQSSQLTQIRRQLEEMEATSHPSESAKLIEMIAKREMDREKRLGRTPKQSEKGEKHEVDLPITNAGPDAKVNITRSSQSTATMIPSPPDPTVISNEELSKRINADSGDGETEDNNNPFHPDGPEPESPSDDGTIQGTIGSIFREELGIDDEPIPQRRAEQARPDAVEDSEEPAEEPQEGDAGEPGNRIGLPRLADRFWGELYDDEPANQPVALPREDQFNPADEADIPPIANGNGHAIAPADVDEVQQQQDAEMLAAGADPDQIEDDDGFEGLLELVGLQGPLLGLLQTSTFCTILVIATVLGAIGLPYVYGKLVLIILGQPVYFLLKFPLQLASCLADLTIDVALTGVSWIVMLLLLSADYVFAALEPWLPALKDSHVTETVSDFVLNTAKVSGTRLHSFFMAMESIDQDPMLVASLDAHASLAVIQGEVHAVLGVVASIVTSSVEAISGGLVWDCTKHGLTSLWQVIKSPPRLLAEKNAIAAYATSTWSTFQSLRSGTLTFHNTKTTVDPLLAYWTSSDRFLAVLTGYLAVAGLATIYVATDFSFTRSEAGQRTEKTIRTSLRQAGGVVKVILIISIEMLGFPLYCGLLLDFITLPIFQGANVATRWTYACNSPYIFCFVHWFFGTCYMFHFALFVGMCRKILRKGVLWFIRDPDDPTFHPVRDVLERPVTTQLRKIAFSALVYGALVILCLGGVIWSIGKIFTSIFPIVWVTAEPVLEFPLDLFLYAAITPFMIRLFKPSTALRILMSWFLRRCARYLRLSHFLFDIHRQYEEGRWRYKTWTSWLSREDTDHSDVYWEKDGKYVLTPGSDQYRPPKAGEAFLYVNFETAYIHDKDGKPNEHFVPIYIPSNFRVRIAVFLVCLWAFSAFLALTATLVPLVLGRSIIAALAPETRSINDVYAYSIGAYSILGVLYVVVFVKYALRWFRPGFFNQIEVAQRIRSAARISLQVLKCAYVYGFAGIVIPALIGMLMQFYLIIPLHTLMHNPPISTAAATANITTAANATLSNSANLLLPALTEPPVPHTIHTLSNYCLGFVYVRVCFRFLAMRFEVRRMIAVAYWLITAEGVFNPNVRFATRFMVLPTVFYGGLALLVPPMLCAVLQSFPIELSHPANSAVMYRLSYPLTVFAVTGAIGVYWLACAIQRWRAAIRDEVYLVGERLHNFGENKPARGGTLIVRH